MAPSLRGAIRFTSLKEMEDVAKRSSSLISRCYILKQDSSNPSATCIGYYNDKDGTTHYLFIEEI